MRILLQIGLFFWVFSLSAQNPFWRGALIPTFNGPADTVYAIVNNSIYKLKDNGQQWIKTADFPLGYSTQSAYVDSDGNLWLSKGDGTIQRSENEGVTWETIARSPASYQQFFKLIGKYMFSIGGGGVYRKMISDTDWETVYNLGNQESVHDVMMNARGDIYISFYQFKILIRKFGETSWMETKGSFVSSPDPLAAVGNRMILGTYWDKVWYRDADAAEWTKSEGDFGTCENCPYGGGGIRDFVVKNENEIYALASDQITTHGWAKSNDGGATFSLIPFPYSNWVRIKTSQLVLQGNNLYLNAGDWGFFFSANDGITWTPINNGIENFRPHHVARMTEDSNGKWWAMLTSGHLSAGPGSSWGVMTSTDQGVTWKSADNDLIDAYNTLEDLLVSEDGNVYAAVYRPGKFNKRPVTEGAWTEINFKMEPKEVDIMGMTNLSSTVIKLQEEGGRIYGSTYWNNMIVTDNGGALWKELKITEGTGPYSGVGVRDFDVQGNKIYAISSDQLGYHGIFKSNDYGTSWTMINSAGINFRKILRYDTMLFAADYGKIYRSNDEGITWTAIQPTHTGINNITFLQVLQLPVSSGELGTTYPFLLMGTNNGLYATQAGFNEWKKLTSGNVYSISEITSTDHILIGYQDGYSAIKTDELLSLKTPQSVTIQPFYTRTFNDQPFTINATATSGLPLTFTSSNPLVATVSGYTITIKGVGTSVITALQAGNEEYAPSSATRELLVAKDEHYITFQLLDSVSLGERTLKLEAFAVSTTPVRFTLEGPGSIEGNTLTMDSIGTYKITAHSDGDSQYIPAEPVTRELVVYDNRPQPTITFQLPDSLSLGEGTLKLEAVVVSTSPLTFTLEGPGSINGNMLTMLSTGTYKITARCEGNSQYLPAEPVTRELVVYDNRLQQTITFLLADSLFSDESPYTMMATSDGNLPVSFEVVSGSATIANNILTFSEYGIIEIRALQPGNKNFKAAVPVVSRTVIKQLHAVSGTIGGPNSEPLQGIIRAILPGGEVSSEATITGNTFTVATRNTGDHYLLFLPSTDAFYPTYYNGTLDWQVAELINIHGTIKGIGWHAIPRETAPKGNSTIMGKVVSDDSGGRKTTVVQGRTKSGEPMKGIQVYLFQPNGTAIITSALSDDAGEFQIEKIPAGRYRLVVDVPGIRMDKTSSVITVGENETVQLSAIVGSSSIVVEAEIVTGIETQEGARLKVYPNPVVDHLFIEADQSVTEGYEILFLNSVGSLLNRLTLNGTNFIDLSCTAPGLYLVQVKNNRGETKCVVKVIKN